MCTGRYQNSYQWSHSSNSYLTSWCTGLTTDSHSESLMGGFLGFYSHHRSWLNLCYRDIPWDYYHYYLYLYRNYEQSYAAISWSAWLRHKPLKLPRNQSVQRVCLYVGVASSWSFCWLHSPVTDLSPASGTRFRIKTSILTLFFTLWMPVDRFDRTREAVFLLFSVFLLSWAHQHQLFKLARLSS